VRAGRALRRARGDAVAVRSRLTGRAAVLVLVIAALLVSYASSLRAYLDQRSHTGSLEASIASSERTIAELEREKRRWRDPAYVEAQARARFAFGYPGEIGFHVLDEDGRPLDAQGTLSPPEQVGDGKPEWWESTLDSIEAAERPVRPEPTPADLVKVPAVDVKPDR
jgi:cell division protein FtsB